MALATIHWILIPWIAVGVALLVWNERWSRATIAAQKAFADTLGIRWLKRWTDFSMRPWLVRGYTILFAILWLAITLVGFFGLLHGKARHH